MLEVRFGGLLTFQVRGLRHAASLARMYGDGTLTDEGEPLAHVHRSGRIRDLDQREVLLDPVRG